LLVAKSALETQNKELESIISFISHDLRTPLVNIKGFSSELKRDCATAYKLLENIELPHEHKNTLAKIFEKYVPESINFIQTSTEFMNNIVTSLVQVARAGIAAVNPEKLDMNVIVETVIKMLETKIKQSSAQIVVEKLPCCIGDKTQITQAITNLIDNAIKYRDPSRGARIRIRGAVSDQQAIYCVEDNGIGIDPRHYDEIFDMFFRLHDKTIGGEGIGLCMVKRMVDRNDGRIWVESQVGAGSKFYVALPFCEQ
jgi:signal transduction histidine kinase